MSDKTSLGDRMKLYENISRIKLTPRMPLICRIDGKAFHSYTRGFKKPMDRLLFNAFIYTSELLFKNIQGVKLVYTQSDEISLLLNDYEYFNTDAWFDKNLQKVVSVASSMCTAYFNKYMWDNKIEKTAFFDARAFVIPREEVSNYFLWRWQDCVRNSVSSLAQANFSAKQLHKVSVEGMKAMLEEKTIVWDNMPNEQKYGSYIESANTYISCHFDKIKHTIDERIKQIEF